MITLDNLYSTLTRKAQTANRGITKEIVEDWVGGVGPVDRQIAFMSAALSALYSGQYTVDKMIEDILHSGRLDN
ncbi:MAG: hypothetical protein C0402_16355 [Thermodesulfovibrio sp.]|nr:hypothetical protein [Thermodesulfovibrio sp.]